MKTRNRLVNLLALGAMLSPLLLVGAGCEQQGPAERAGESIDRGVENVKDTISPPGPAEKAGREVDKAVNP